MIKTSNQTSSSLIIIVAILVSLQYVVVQSDRISQTRCAEYRAQSRDLAGGLNCSNTRTILNGIELGAADAEPGEFPHQAMLGWNSGSSSESIEFNCGGTLISPLYVLTSAVCIRMPPQIVRLGATKLNETGPNQRDYEVDSWLKHPQHSYTRAYHDIALVKLKEPVQFTAFIKPACLGVNSTDGDTDTSMLATGFGTVSWSGERNHQLRKTLLEFLPLQQCEEAFGSSRRLKEGISQDQMCVGTFMDGSNSCQIDAGSPIQRVLDPDVCLYNVLGVDSLGSVCGLRHSPEIFTSVENHLDWIESVVWA
ncbi:serine protease snake-like [Uranotaenia lowii]|uniref:serine protease snake-like n=1 Tax=Uranotaenia lowii TaxID=190385 RepID=UPI00247B2A54|nr:serine protease snake-like [Uranotaenia lowii]